MKIKYLGTAAAEGVPSMFCECEFCNKVRKIKGKNIRTRSQALIDNKILIDFGPDTNMHLVKYGIHLGLIKDILITHSHPDHLDFNELINAQKHFAKYDDEITVHVTQSSFDLINKMIQKEGVEKFDGKIRLHLIKPYDVFKIGRYKVTVLPANHNLDTDPVIYVISKGNKSLLYGNDTGYFKEEVWKYIEEMKLAFDLISLDSTHGPNRLHLKPDYKKDRHMGYETNVLVKNRLKEIGAIDDETICILNHFSHNGHTTYEEYSELACTEKFIIAYDGFSQNF